MDGLEIEKVSKDDRHTEFTPPWIEAAAAQIRSPTFTSYFVEDLDGLLEKCNDAAGLFAAGYFRTSMKNG